MGSSSRAPAIFALPQRPRPRRRGRRAPSGGPGRAPVRPKVGSPSGALFCWKGSGRAGPRQRRRLTTGRGSSGTRLGRVTPLEPRRVLGLDPRSFPNPSAGRIFLDTAPKKGGAFLSARAGRRRASTPWVTTPLVRGPKVALTGKRVTKQGIKPLRRKRPAGHAKAKKCIYIFGFWCRRADMLSF